MIESKNIEISQIYLNIEFMIIYIRIWIRYIFVRNYDFIYMIMENFTMNWFWYPNQWELFIGTLIPGVIHWYSDAQPIRVIHRYFDTHTNGNYSLVLWYPNQWGLFIGILIPKPVGVIHWYSNTQPTGVIYWYSDA